MQQKKSISAPKIGMSRDTHMSQLQNTQYSLGVNINTSNEAGESWNVQNEPSNYFSVQFPETYKVIGFRREELRTYFFLTSITEDEESEHYKRSSIGYVENLLIDAYNQDEETSCGDCNPKNLLEEPLENIEQTPSQEYVELVHDRCISLSDIEEQGLNFDINFPIKKIEAKNEKSGLTLYWDDYRNPSRYLQVSRIEEAIANNTFDYLHTEDIACDDPQETPCLDVSKLLVFPNYRRMSIEAKEEQIGGNLKKGTYEFWGAYCDPYGNEITEYCTPTNPISIWDEYNNILEQTELDEFTNYAIKLKVHNLDVENFKYYKIAVVERNNVQNTQSVFLAGIFPTTDDTVVYTHSGTNNDDLYVTRGNISVKKRMDFSTLTAIKPNYSKFKGTMVSDDRLFHFGAVEEGEINLQPVVNLFSSLLHWETSASNENLYKSFIATSKFKGIMRNEVQPFAIRFHYANGGYSSNFPFIGRPLLGGEDDLVDDLNSQSINFAGNSCATTERTKKWQIFNTAKVYDTPCNDFTEGGIELDPEEVTKSCFVEDVATIPADEIKLTLGETFYDLQTYINEHREEICEPTSEFYNATICSYLEDTYEEITPCEPYFGDNCDAPTLTSQEVLVGEVEGEVVEYNEDDEKALVDYVKSIPPNFCYPYQTDNTTGAYKEDETFTTTNALTPCVGSDRRKVYLRQGSFLNESCTYPTTIANQTDPTQSGVSLYFNYDGSTTETDLYDSNASFLSTSSTYFKSNIHDRAQFFKINRNNRNKFILEFTAQSGCIGAEDYFEDINNTLIRYTIYEKCSTGATPLKSAVVDLSDATDLLQEIDVTTFPSAQTASSYIVAIDCAIRSTSVRLDCSDILTTRDIYYVAPPCSCISIYTRDIEYDTVSVSWTGINIYKKFNYESTCTFTLPNVNGCDIIPFKKGQMAYWESTNEYPDNKQLFDSSTLFIKPSDLNNLSLIDREEFLEFYTNGIDENGNYILKNADFRCQKIRHPKLPDNTIAPYILDNLSTRNGSEAIIFPLGVNLDDKVVQAMINVAYTNGLLTKKQRENIVGWEILRGDNSIHKSVIANGIGFDMYNYTDNNEKIHFANFPYNDLGENKFLLNPLDNRTIKHPYSGNKNHLFSFLSPDLFLTSPTIPSELSLQGYLFGNAEAGFANVKKHPEWTVLGRDSYTVSEILAGAEVVLEALIKYTELQVQANQGLWFVGGFTNGTGSAGTGVSSGLNAVLIASMGLSAFFKYGEYRYNWLQIFRNLGRMDNFASFQYSNAKYSKFLKVDNENPDYLRRLFVRKYLKDGDYNVVDESDGSSLKINNWKREYFSFLSTGENFPINYLDTYKNFDNNRINPTTSSNFLNSDTDCDNNKGFTRDVASPYFSLKNYIPDQWDTLDSIKWLTTNYIFDLDEDTSCTPIYGGTVVISRFSWRKKVPIFNDNAIFQPDKLPYKYSRNKNIGKPRFYCDYETADDAIFNYGSVFPDIRSDYNFDCQTGRNSFYLRPPSKFYLFVHSVADFLVESEINCNFRYGKKQPKDQFYNGQNLSEWLQEENLPIVEPNTFYYNNTYSFPVSNSQYKHLDRTYDKDIWAKRAVKNNAWIWSEKDVNENSTVDPWLVYKPLNFWEDKSNRGKLIDLRSIESDQFFGRYEDQLQLFNPANQVADAINAQNKELGSGFMSSRPITFKKSDLGFAGTQNTDFVSTPYGHFWVDAKRGRVFQVDQNGQQLETISEVAGGKPTGMVTWFREHLPFKILKYFPEADIDNKFKGLGINMWWDDKESRLFITKRDYILKPNSSCVTLEDNDFYCTVGEVKTKISLQDENYFKDVSWTMTYKPKEGMWNSYFTFYPDYSIAHQNFFQIGYNYGRFEETMWNHTLDNRSFCVFQGEYNPWVLEFPVTNENVSKILNSLSINIESRRYINKWDYSIHKDIGVTDMFIWNATKNTGYLVLHPQKTLADERNYPRTEGNKQHILTTFEDNKQHVNYFFNRMINQDNNVPMFKRDENNIFKEIDPRAVKFGGKKVLERITGDTMLVNLSNTQDSRFNILIKSIINDETVYE